MWIARLAMAMILVLAFCGSLLAQGHYFLRPKAATNVRAEPSQASQRIGQARPGQTILVSGESDGWLQVIFDDQEAWMAGWLDYDFFGKDGELHFTSAVGGMSCERGPSWGDSPAGGYWLMTSARCDLDLQPPASMLPPHMRTIDVQGPDDVAAHVHTALDSLQTRAPQWYAYVASVIDNIIVYEQGSRYDVVSGMAYVNPHEPSIYISRHGASMAGRGRASLAGLIVHESCHRYEHINGLRLASYESEVLCHTMELYALQAMDAQTSVPSVEKTIEFLLFLGE